MSNINDPIFEAYRDMDRSAGFRRFMSNQSSNNPQDSETSDWKEKITATSEHGKMVADKLKEIFKDNHGLSPALWGRALKICNELTKLVDEANSDKGRMIK
jgi:hypothetical protein